MPQISGANSQENHIIETCKEEACAVSTKETAAVREWEDETFDTLIGSLGPIAVPIRVSPTNLREEIHITPVVENRSPSTAQRGGCHSAMSRNFHDEMSAAMWSSHSQLTVHINRHISDGNSDAKTITSLQFFKHFPGGLETNIFNPSALGKVHSAPSGMSTF
jgi:hypothetical protein